MNRLLTRSHLAPLVDVRPLGFVAMATAALGCADPAQRGPTTAPGDPSASEGNAGAQPSENTPSTAPSPAAASLPDTYAFAFVTLGALAEGPFYERVDKRGPALLAHLWGEDELPPAIATTVERAFGTAEQRWATFEGGVEEASVALDPDALPSLGLAPPEAPIWLIGPCGPVRAEIDRPVLSWYSWGLESVELSWTLRVDPSASDCADPGAWSQIAVLAETLPESLRYRSAVERSAGQVVGPKPTMANPHPEITEPIVAAAVAEGDPPDEVWLREIVIPGTDLVELTTALVQRDPGEPGRAPEPCYDEQDNTVQLGRAREAGFERVTLIAGPGPVGSELRGAFVLGEEPIWSVHESWGQAVVAELGGAMRVVELVVASFHPEDFGEQSFAQTEYCGP